MKVKHILVAMSDPSAKASPAIDKAAALARKLGADVTLFHSVYSPYVAGEQFYSPDALQKDIEGAVTLRKSQLARVAAGLEKAGVTVAFGAGTDRFGATGLRNVPYAAAQAVAFGMSADEALRGLTLVPAGMLGIADRVGSLEPGKEATLFVADGDILDIRTQVRRMWIAGREVSLESKHTRLHNRYRSRPKSAR